MVTYYFTNNNTTIIYIKKEVSMTKNKTENKSINNFIKQFSNDLIVTNEDGTVITPKYRTGILNLDILLNGGFPIGRIIGIGAEWGVGKTTLLIQACGNIIERYNKNVYYIDVEGGATYDLFESMGYAELLYNAKTNPTGRFYLINVETLQDVSKIIHRVTREDDTALIVIDSVTQVLDASVLEDEELGSSKKNIGYDARMWSKVAKPYSAVLKKSKACLILVQQARRDISGFKPRIVASGGNAIKHMTSSSIFGTRDTWIEDMFRTTTYRKGSIGAYVDFTTTKNRLKMPYKSIKIPILFGRGASNLWMAKEWLNSHGYVDKETKQVIPFLKSSVSWHQFNLPFLNEKVQGNIVLYETIEHSLDKILEYIYKTEDILLDLSS